MPKTGASRRLFITLPYRERISLHIFNIAPARDSPPKDAFRDKRGDRDRRNQRSSCGVFKRLVADRYGRRYADIGLKAKVAAVGSGYTYIDFYHREPHQGDDDGNEMPIRGLWINGIDFEYPTQWWGE